MQRRFRGNKFGAKPTVIDGLRFDSKKEAKRWGELKALEATKQIKQLQRQVSIPLTVNGKKICTYRADFVYQQDGQTVVEDAKGFQTDVFKIKWKWAQVLHPEWRFLVS